MQSNNPFQDHQNPHQNQMHMPPPPYVTGGPQPPMHHFNVQQPTNPQMPPPQSPLRFEYVGGDAPQDLVMFAYNCAVEALGRIPNDQFNPIAKFVSDSLRQRFKGKWCVMVFQLGNPLGSSFFNENHTLAQFNINGLRFICFQSHK